MKVFFLVSRVPWPLEKGDKLRAYHQLKELAKYNDVYLCCLSDSKIHPDAMAQLQKITPHVKIIKLNKLLISWQLLRALVSKKPFQVHYFFQQHAQNKIRQAIDDFKPDHIYCQLIRTSEYVKNLHQYKKTIDYMDALSAGQRRRIEVSKFGIKYLVREEATRLAAYENLVFDYFDHHIIISEQDKKLIYHEHREKIKVVPNGVDLHFFSSQKINKKYDLIFCGNMSYPPNIDCAICIVNDILPLVKKSIPNVSLLIAGANPHQDVIDLANDEVTVSGWMDDIRAAYDESRVFVAPMRIGSGLQNKLLEAMSMNLPCVTTSLAANPLNAIDGKHMLIADSHEAIANAIILLLGDDLMAKKIAAEGRQFVMDHFNWESTVRNLNDIISSPR